MTAAGQQDTSGEIDRIVLFRRDRSVCDERRPEPPKRENRRPCPWCGGAEYLRGDEHRVDRQPNVQRGKTVQWPVIPDKKAEHRIGNLAVGARSPDRHEEETQKPDGAQHDESGRVVLEFFALCCHPGDEDEQEVDRLIYPHPTRIEANRSIECRDRKRANREKK